MLRRAKTPTHTVRVYWRSLAHKTPPPERAARVSERARYLYPLRLRHRLVSLSMLCHFFSLFLFCNKTNEIFFSSHLTTRISSSMYFLLFFFENVDGRSVVTRLFGSPSVASSRSVLCVDARPTRGPPSEYNPPGLRSVVHPRRRAEAKSR